MSQRNARVVARQSKAVAASVAELSTTIDTVLAMLRTAVHDRGWTLEALEAEMGLDKSLISRVLNGERPLTLTFLIALPDDIEATFSARYAEHHGQIVVAPVHGEQAVRQLVGGLLGVLSPRLPVKADRLAKATLPIAEEAAS